ncbi:MAG TPA: phosphoglucosamine mutase, partial [Bacillota bacterium]
MARLFGTDGVRGVVNGDLTPLFAMQLGWALAMELEQQGRRGPVAIGRDTRRSGPMLGAALAAGLCSAGCDVLDLGVLPTPGVAWCTRAAGVAAGVVISASHNPPEYNGIKIFAADGYKLPDAAEDALERRLEPSGAALGRRLAPATEVGRVDPVDLADRYLEFLTGRAAASAGGLPVVLDCGHGAAFRLAPALFERLGARVTVLNDRPDGLNINQGCGSTHPTVVAEAVRRRGAAVGFSFDGDADRCIAVDERGQVVDGDAILAIAALDRQRRGALPGAGVVATIMSNLGLERALRRAGITLHRSPVGDR